MILDGIGHSSRQTVVQRVVTAHDALQFGEFADHVGQQVGLGEPCGEGGLFREFAATEFFGNGAGNRHNAKHALALRAQLVVINDSGQPLNPRFERFLAILIEEKFGVGQSRTHHALIAANHGGRVLRTDVADQQELVGQFSGFIKQREVFLVGLHRQDQAFLRHGEEFGFKLPDQHVRQFDQRGHFVEQRLVGNRVSPGFGRSGFQLPGDFGTAFGKRGDDRALFTQEGGIAGGIG